MAVERVIVEKNLDIPMRDGVILRADLYRPADAESTWEFGAGDCDPDALRQGDVGRRAGRGDAERAQVGRTRV